MVVSPKIYQLFAAPAEIEATGKKEFLTESAFFSFFKIVYAIHVHSTVQYSTVQYSTAQVRICRKSDFLKHMGIKLSQLYGKIR